MKPKLKGFVVWFIAPYLTLIVLEFLVRWPRTSASAILQSFHWSVEAIILLFCALQAGLGTAVMWLLPIKRPWFGVVLGVCLSIAAVAIWVLVETELAGGFEANIGISITAIVMVVPSCLAAAYVGVLRSKC